MRVFVSYHTPDLEKARAIETAMSLRRPGTTCYLAPRNNIVGAYWLPRLSEEIAACDAVVFLAGNRIGPWQELEYLEALRLSRESGGRPRLVPVVLSRQAPGLPFFAQLHQIFAPDPVVPEAVAAIDRALDEGVSPTTLPAWQCFQPYKGLPALQESDAAFFFGREKQTADVLDLLATKPDRIIALVGHSGVGKSSLARAGILAAMRSQFWPLTGEAWPIGLANSRSFLQLVIRPGEAPLKELALAFAQLYLNETYEIDREARGWAQNFADGASLHDLLRVTGDKIAAALEAEPPKRFVLYLDQTEELYAAGDLEISRRFSALIAEAADHEAFSVMMSLRSDYYSSYQEDTDLFQASERIDILPLLPEELAEVIRRPALGHRLIMT
jgi:conflict system STAND superfamily ATPase/TIR domain-containing protein